MAYTAAYPKTLPGVRKKGDRERLVTANVSTRGGRIIMSRIFVVAVTIRSTGA